MALSRNRSIAARVLSGGTAATIGRILIAAIGLGTNVLLAKILSPSDVGGYFLAFSLINILAVFSQLGLQQAILRIIPEAYTSNSEKNNIGALVLWFNVFVTSFAICVAICLFILGDSIFTKFIGSGAFVGSFFFLSLWLIFGASKLIVSSCFRAFHDIPLATTFNGVVSSTIILTTLLIIYWTKIDLQLKYVIAIASVANAVAYVLGFFILLRRTRGVRMLELYKLRRYFSIALPMWITTSSIIILGQIDVWIISRSLFEDSVALYGSALKLATLVSMPFFIITAVAPPIVSELHFNENYEKLKTMLRSASTFASIPSFIALTTFLLFGDEILNFLFGEFYIDASTILSILVIGHFIKVTFGAGAIALSMTGNHRFVMTSTLFFGVVKITTGVAAIKIGGLNSFAVVASSLIVLQAFVEMIVFRMRSGIWTCASLNIKIFLKYFKEQKVF